MREDGREDDVFSIIGPKKYDVPWKDLERQGWIATACCHEVRIPLADEQRMAYALAPRRQKYAVAARNPRKFDIVGALLAFLQSRVQDAVPAVLEIVIGNALGTRDVVQAETAFVLRVTNKKLYAAITTSPMLKPFLLDVPGPDTLAVSLARLDEFKEKLDRLGVKLAPLTPVAERPDWHQTVSDAKTRQRRRIRYDVTITTHYSPLTTHHSPFTTHHSPNPGGAWRKTKKLLTYYSTGSCWML